MAVAKSCGRVDIVSLESHSTVSSFQLFSLPIDHETGKPVLNKHKKSMHFIGLGFFEGRILTGTDNGLVWEFSINVPFVAAAPIEPMHLDQDLLCALKVNPLSPNLFATGGDEKEVCVWDVNALKMSDGICAEPIWKAKNVSLPPTLF